MTNRQKNKRKKGKYFFTALFKKILFCPDSDMSSGSVGMMPTDEDSSDEEMRRDVLHDMKEEEERNLPSSALSLFSTADAFFHSQNPKNEEKSRLFTKPCLVRKANVLVSLQCASVLMC